MAVQQVGYIAIRSIATTCHAALHALLAERMEFAGFGSTLECLVVDDL